MDVGEGGGTVVKTPVISQNVVLNYTQYDGLSNWCQTLIYSSKLMVSAIWAVQIEHG